ncbi:PIG-L family deacetylase [Candidatus Woesearchaeota archaeon]|nr:PIG-L family deacetylase [Candidatus Woesearchaeota archaeon]
MHKDIPSNVVVFSAHTDDFVIGAGGTIAKYAQEGKKVTAIVFSLGEKSHPWLKESVIKDVRAEEALRAGKVLGCEVIYFDLKDQDILKEYKEKNIESKLLSLLNKIRPDKIITHSSVELIK